MVEGNDLGRFFELAPINKINVNCSTLHEIRSENLEDYTGVFQLIGSVLIGEIEQETNIRFKNIDEFENSFNAIDVDYDFENGIFTGWLLN